MFYLTQMDQTLSEKGQKLLADGGYPGQDDVLVIPNKSNGKIWNLKQKELRSVVEQTIGCVKCFRVAGDHCRLSPEMQIICLRNIYYIVAMDLREYPLRIL
jgi:hypothetical protein